MDTQWVPKSQHECACPCTSHLFCQIQHHRSSKQCGPLKLGNCETPVNQHSLILPCNSIAKLNMSTQRHSKHPWPNTKLTWRATTKWGPPLAHQVFRLFLRQQFLFCGKWEICQSRHDGLLAVTGVPAGNPTEWHHCTHEVGHRLEVLPFALSFSCTKKAFTMRTLMPV